MGQIKSVGGGVFDPSTGTVISADQANAIVRGGAATSGARPPVTLGLDGPGDQSFGFELPNQADMSPDTFDGMAAIPQLAGLLASFHPALRTAKGAMAVPAVVEAITEMLQGKGISELDPTAIGGQALTGLAGHGVGATLGAVGRGGEGIVRRSMNIREPFDTRAGEAMLPKLAIREKATMTIPGVDKIADKAKATGAGGLEDLAAVLERARKESALGPNVGGGGLMAMISDIISRPRQMAIGSAMASPFGVGTEKVLAPTAETGVRGFLTWLTSQLGDGGESAPPASAGPRRRSLGQ